MSKLALIAGEGDLPGHLASVLGRAGRAWFACHMDGFVPSGVGQSRGFRIEHLGSFIASLRADDVSQICFAGRIARPSLDPAALDAETLPLVPRMMQALQSGDDAALRLVITLFEEAGLQVIGAQEIDPSLLDLPIHGAPSEGDLTDIVRAASVHGALAPLDVGQGVVVARGQVLAMEALPGTDHMLAAIAQRPKAPQPREPAGGLDLLGGAADWLSGGALPSGALPDFVKPAGGVFFKAAKAGQDRRIDMPTIGPETVRRVAEAGLNGLAVEEGGVLVLRQEEVARTLRERGLFLTRWTQP